MVEGRGLVPLLGIGVIVVPLALSSCGETTILQGDQPGVMSTVAGGGTDPGGSGISALDLTLPFPRAVLPLPDGGFYVVEAGFSGAFGGRIFLVDAAGVANVVAGTTTSGFGGDDGPATRALLNEPSGIARADDGTLYIADMMNNRIRTIAPDGTITTIAGKGARAFEGDGGPASEALLNHPWGLLLTPEGDLLIADSGNNRVRKIDPSGTITTIAGTGDFRYNGEGLPAIASSLFAPSGLARDPEGNLYIADASHHRIRKIDRSGIMTTLAGTGVAGFAGDGGPALQARLSSPLGVAVTLDGKGLFIADTVNHRVRFLGTDGTIFTVAGTGTGEFNGDGLFATEAGLKSPAGVALDAFGNLYITDTGNFRVRRVPFPEQVLPGGAPRGPLGVR